MEVVTQMLKAYQAVTTAEHQVWLYVYQKWLFCLDLKVKHRHDIIAAQIQSLQTPVAFTIHNTVNSKGFNSDLSLIALNLMIQIARCLSVWNQALPYRNRQVDHLRALDKSFCINISAWFCSWRMTHEKFKFLSKESGVFNQKSLEFQNVIMERSGLGNDTSLPPGKKSSIIK